ncbi:MAG: hypothetical protein KDB90_09915 [Planctomycetes bacterium]|nr:hypothetical protein [Planctomycetota bacterium]
MAVRLSRAEGRFSVLLTAVSWLDPALVAPELARVLKLPRSDTVRACRLQRGILFEGAEEAAAGDAVKALADYGVEAVCVPDSELPILPKPVHVSLSHIDREGFGTPSITGAGMPKLWPWDNLVLLAGGVIMDPDALSAGLFDKIEEDGFSDATDRQSMAAKQLERARDRVFPLAREVEHANKQLGEALEAALSGKSTAGAPEVEGFGKIDTVLDLLFTKPFERLRVTSKGRVTGLDHTASRARNLHAAVKTIVPFAGDATQPGATLALAHGADSGEYLFEDLSQFDAYCRWNYYWRLKRGV